MTAANGKQAVSNARKFTRYDVGMCQKFVRGEAWQIGSLYGSAIDAWHGAMHKHPGDRKPPLGAPMFYSGGQYGHIVINTGPGDIRSTDCPSSGQVSEADTDWPVRSWGDTYLGWTEDLNGVRLPLGEEDEMTEDDWDRLRNIVRDEVWQRKLDVDKPDGSPTKKAAGQMLREILQRVQK
jgi:hypothetical protein